MMPSQYLHVSEPTWPLPDHSGMSARGSSNDGVLDVRLAVSGNASRFEFVSDEAFIERGIGSIDRSAQMSDWHYRRVGQRHPLCRPRLPQHRDAHLNLLLGNADHAWRLSMDL